MAGFYTNLTGGPACAMFAGRLLGDECPKADRAPAQQAFERRVDGAELAVARRAVETHNSVPDPRGSAGM